MKPELTLRTLVVAPWLVALLYAGPGVDTGLLALAILLVWAAPLVRDRRPGPRSR
ncbi:hypothetical protein AB0F81_10515 [Actinoplanes sp. NPDC024001]|uniref:hypothetical protein n=1 Tax=Actinoplanes sp. NPDC024001 TaxID=3154598 RepID=UPI0033E0D4D3